MYRFACFVAFVVCLSAQAHADTITIFGRKFDKSVATYGSFIVPPGPTERAGENAKAEFYLKPSITLHKFNDKTVLVAYSIFAVLQDRKGFSFNNKATFSLGLELQHKLSNATRLSFGIRQKTEHEFLTRVTRSRLILTADLNVYKTWESEWVKKRLKPGSRIILSGWANYRYPGSLHRSEDDNGLLQGAFKFATSIPLRDTKLSVAPFVSLKAKADHKGRAFNNIIEPAFGVDLNIPFKRGGSISVGTKSVYQWRHATGTSEAAILGYVSWYKKF